MMTSFSTIARTKAELDLFAREQAQRQIKPRLTSCSLMQTSEKERPKARQVRVVMKASLMMKR